MPGLGVVAKVRHQDLGGTGDAAALRTVVVGNRRMLDRGDIAFSAEIAALVKSREGRENRHWLAAIDGQVVGVIGVRETVRRGITASAAGSCRCWDHAICSVDRGPTAACGCCGCRDGAVRSCRDRALPGRQSEVD